MFAIGALGGIRAIDFNASGNFTELPLSQSINRSKFELCFQTELSSPDCKISHTTGQRELHRRIDPSASSASCATTLAKMPPTRPRRWALRSTLRAPSCLHILVGTRLVMLGCIGLDCSRRCGHVGEL